MRAVLCDGAGGRDVLRWGDAPDPQPGPGEVVVAVAAAGINRADVMQRQGFYPPPPGASDVLGLECSGTVAAVGDGVDAWQVGDEVCALLAGGGAAERVAVPAGQVMPVPDGVDLVTAAALPEAVCTVWSTLVMAAGLTAGESVLVHGGGSGIGTTALQLLRALGAGPVLTTVGSAAKAEVCRQLGADVTIDYHAEDFAARAREVTGSGVDVVLDIIGAKYLERNLAALAPDGRLAVIGLQGGGRAELDLVALLQGRKRIIATTLRSRPVEQKAAICRAVVDSVWPLVASGAVRPVVHAVLPMDHVADAHAMVEESSHTGKVLLRVP